MDSITERLEVCEENLSIMQESLKECVALLRLLGKIHHAVTGENGRKRRRRKRQPPDESKKKSGGRKRKAKGEESASE